VLTHTIPWPPPCAGALVAGSVTAGFAAAGLAAAGAADAEVFGLNKSRSVNLLRFSVGEAGAAAVLSAAAGEAAAVASAFFCARRFPGDGDAAGDSAGEGDAASSAGEAVAWAGDPVGEGDAASSAGEAVASAFLCARCFVGEGDSSGDPPGTSN
jgi:hypothetical protein